MITEPWHWVCHLCRAGSTVLRPLDSICSFSCRTSFDLTGLTIPPTAKIHPARLSLTDQATITALSTMVGKEHMGCDILINNAGIYYFQENITAVQRQETLDVNYRGTLNVDHRILFSFLPPTNHRQVCQAFLPIMRKNGRIVNLSSQSGQLKYFDPSLQKRFLYPDLTLTELDALVNEYSVRYFDFCSFLVTNSSILALSRPAHCDRIGLAPLGLFYQQGCSERCNTDSGPRKPSSTD